MAPTSSINKPSVQRTPTSNTYCVPAALSALMGLPVDEVMPLIKEHLGDQPVSGIFIPVAIAILRAAGFTLTELHYADQFNVKKFAYRVPAAPMFLVTIRGHALVIHDRLAIDSGNPTGISVDGYYRRAAQVEQAWEVSK